MKHPNRISAYYLEDGGYKGNQVKVLGGWVSARPMGFPSLKERITLAWLVFKGEADALFWAGQ